ncbi:hypothetical protein K435DRAFT_700978, partial [Dendrothele bispora CBS 962.96]
DSKLVNHPTSDITLQSSDRVLFKVHRRNLEMYSQVFADAANATATVPISIPTPASTTLSDSSSSSEIVHLSESSAVLDLMFQYMYLQPQPDLRKVDFDVIKDLAEAVEKYCVYSAMGALKVGMREHIPSQPVEVLLYAIRHNYPELINESAEATLEFPPYPMLQRVPPEVFSAWVRLGLTSFPSLFIPNKRTLLFFPLRRTDILSTNIPCAPFQRVRPIRTKTKSRLFFHPFPTQR